MSINLRGTPGRHPSPFSVGVLALLSSVAVHPASALPPDVTGIASAGSNLPDPRLIGASGIRPRWQSGTWPEPLEWLHVIGDTVICAVCIAIPVGLAVYGIRRKSTMPWAFWLFAAFIASCGIGHLLEAAVFWVPVYRLAGVWKAITALASAATLLALLPILPKARLWPSLDDVNTRLKPANESIEQCDAALEAANRELRFHKRALDEHAIVAITDRAGRITYANDLFCRISGYSREELIGQDHRIINSGTHPKSFFSDLYRTITSGRTWRGDICNRAKDGSLYWVKTTIVPRLDDNGRPQQYIAVRDDISHLILTDQKLARAVERLENTGDELARKNEELEMFIHSSSHDLKSPLVTIMGYASLLKRDISPDADPDELRNHAARIESAAGTMKRIVDDLLELSRIGRVLPEFALISTNHAVDEILDQLRESLDERGVRVTKAIQQDLVFTDRKRILQLLSNLIANAVKHGCDPDDPRIEIGIERHDENLRLYVQDNGPGIAPEHHERIFRLFERLSRRKDSTGVGLAIVQRIAAVLGGRAWLESSPNRGATFWVELAGVPTHQGTPIEARTIEERTPCPT